MAEGIQAIGGAGVPGLNTIVAPANTQNTTPFQIMLDAAISGLREVSAAEAKADAYIVQYSQGNVSMEETLMEVQKMTMAVQMATTVVNQVVSTFKEIEQIPV
ncbi:flagellar hook-basal body complex protein FliE [Candidatus Termititenax persephonae]|uniref:Flagellar hook-basal body complex protein FliE n=1 Tax=Candidatus Termititenax persephonae TaxID=2218525 RepID=A0A388TFZ5_9BACT|nr:flagellar hook-basal body complex protein FliE [Candidatus Termititenax persephonae]